MFYLFHIKYNGVIVLEWMKSYFDIFEPSIKYYSNISFNIVYESKGAHWSWFESNFFEHSFFTCKAHFWVIKDGSNDIGIQLFIIREYDHVVVACFFVSQQQWLASYSRNLNSLRIVTSMDGFMFIIGIWYFESIENIKYFLFHIFCVKKSLLRITKSDV